MEGKDFTFGNNDVIGCGWNKKEKMVFFTKNGEMLGMKLTFTITNHNNLFKLFSNPELSKQRNFELLNFYPCVKFNSEAFAVANFGQSRFAFNITEYVWTKIFQIGEALPEMGIKPTIFSVSDSTEELGHSILGTLFTVKTDAPGISQKVCYHLPALYHDINMYKIIGSHKRG